MNYAKLVQCVRICRSLRHRRDATRLWNAIDHMDKYSEDLWGIMARVRPEFFKDPSNANSIYFTYDTDN